MAHTVAELRYNTRFKSACIHMSLFAVGINHKTAPLELREKLAFQPEQLPEALRDLQQQPYINEATILSTCNRTEIYCDASLQAKPCEWLAQHYALPYQQLTSSLYTYHDEAAVQHIIRVASGLDSMVLGEPQILGQLKSAFVQAQNAGAVGTHLQRLFQWVFATSKRVRHDTQIGVNPVSVAYTAVHLARRIFADLSKRSVLLIGAGETIELAAQYLVSQGIQQLFLTNRNHARAQQIGQRWGAQVFPLEQLTQYLGSADIVIAATSSPLPLLGKGSVETALKQRKRQPILMLDIAMPRDIEPEVAQLADVYLYNIDDLKALAAENQKSRQAAAIKAEQLIQIEVAHFMRQLQALEAVPTIKAYREHIAGMREQTVNQALRALASGAQPNEVIIELAQRLTNKIMHGPSAQLRRAAYEGDLNSLDLARRFLNIKD